MPQHRTTTATHYTRTAKADCMGAHTRINLPQFEKYCLVRGLDTDEAIAQFLGVTAVTVGRIRKGIRGPGGDFIAAAVLAFRPYGLTFDDLFIAEPDDDADAA